jgi:hypothetical protein
MTRQLAGHSGPWRAPAGSIAVRALTRNRWTTGTGTSTALRMFARLEDVDAGAILITDCDVTIPSTAPPVNACNTRRGPHLMTSLLAPLPPSLG